MNSNYIKTLSFLEKEKGIEKLSLTEDRLTLEYKNKIRVEINFTDDGSLPSLKEFIYDSEIYNCFEDNKSLMDYITKKLMYELDVLEQTSCEEEIAVCE